MKFSLLKKRVPRWVKVILTLLAVPVVLVLLLNMLIFLIPYPGLDDFMDQQYSTRFYDRNGELLQILPLEEGLHREFYSLEKIPVEIQEEFIKQEDKNFYSHSGVDYASVFRAASQNKKAGSVVSGASTITMQLVRIIQPREKQATLGTKISEAFHAYWLEKKLSKRKILELYLNNVPFGFQVEGIGSAARSFYGTTPEHLTPEQIKTLALVPRRPADYAPEKTFEYPFKAPHYINYLTNQYKEKGKTIPCDLKLALDNNLVEGITDSINYQLEKYQDARIHNGSALVINNHTGEIIAWVGNCNFFDEEHSGQIDGVTVKNQPGSSMKPFLYAQALESGFFPNSILPDIQQDFGGSGVYVPLNFNNQYNGPVRFRVALASSLNIPAVYLLYHLGVDNYMEKLQQLGYKSLEGTRDSTGLSIALGSSEVTLYEMVHAFSVFPNDGMLKGKKVFEKDTARIMCNILSDNSVRELGFGHAQVFKTPYDCIFKTGTSNQFQNIIALGATTEFTVGVWMGNFEGETVVGKTGSSIPALVAREILDILSERYGAGKFKQPETYDSVEICTLSGLIPNEFCTSRSMEYIHKSARGSIGVCNWHSVRNGRVEINYPSEYQHWAQGRNLNSSIMFSESELEITYPRNGAVFVYDPSLPQEVQMLTVMASGGYAPSAVLYSDGRPVQEKGYPFSWKIPLTRGLHTVEIKCGPETKKISYEVK